MPRSHLFSAAIARLSDGPWLGQALDAEISVHPRSFAAGETISAAGPAVQHIVLVSSGFVAREYATKQGGRALTDLLLPLDFALLESLTSPEIGCDLVAVTDCEVAVISHYQLRLLARQQPALWPALFRAVSDDNGRLHSHLCNVSRRFADTRVAHFFAELYLRMAQKEMLLEDGFEFPVSQRNLADLVGLSLVHINRTLQTLRSRDLVRWHGRRLIVPSISQLLDFANGSFVDSASSNGVRGRRNKKAHLPSDLVDHGLPLPTATSS